MSQARQDVTRVIEQAYVQLDKDKDGEISRGELKVLLDKIFGTRYPEKYVDIIFEHGDKNGSGTIDSVQELVDAFYSIKAIIICCRLIAILDKDSNGILSKEELESKLESCEYPEVIALIKGAPLNAGDEISCEDFFGHCLLNLL